jgi:hypothetical protein
MASKAEERALRRQAKIEKFEASKSTILASVGLVSEPRIAAELAVGDSPRVAPRLAASVAARSAAKVPSVVETGSRLGEKVTWCISRKDCDGHWSWNEPRAWDSSEWDIEIHPKMTAFEKDTWGEIEKHVTGKKKKRHRMHHSHELGDLAAEAQQRWHAIDLGQFETLWRFRLGGAKRVWGFIVRAHFHMVWWERYHKIYPVD